MRYAELSCTDFYSFYLQQCYSIDLFPLALLAMARRIIWIRTVRPVQKFSWNWLFSFFLELYMVLGAHVVLCMTARFFKEMFYLQNGDNRPIPEFFECTVQESLVFFSVLYFLSVWSIMKVCITVILLSLNKFHISENSGS